MVAVTGAPGTDALLRRAARMATRLKGDLDVVHVTATDGANITDKAVIEKLTKLTDVGGRWHDLKDDDAARAIAEFARANQITQIVIGSSQRSRWQQLTGGGSNVARVIREAGPLGIDVHVIALHKPAKTAVTKARAAAKNDTPDRLNCP
jgi:two-component system, OmpR family, sensor histidine kinase KdpD